MADTIYHYEDDEGNSTNYIPDIVNQSVTMLCYEYIEDNKDKRPTYREIQEMVNKCMSAMLLEGADE